jgi:hypothetical protein
MRLPVAWNTVLAMAGATPTTPISPTDLPPSGLEYKSGSPTEMTSMSGMSKNPV